jgi:hypothetical protein
MAMWQRVALGPLIAAVLLLCVDLYARWMDQRARAGTLAEATLVGTVWQSNRSKKWSGTYRYTTVQGQVGTIHLQLPEHWSDEQVHAKFIQIRCNPEDPAECIVEGASSRGYGAVLAAALFALMAWFSLRHRR